MAYRILKHEPAAKSTYIPHTHTHTNRDAIPLDSWSISRDNTILLVSLCVHRDASTIPLASLQQCNHKDALSHKLPIKMSPSLSQAQAQPSPPSWVLCFYAIYLTKDNTAQRVCSPGAGFNPSEHLWPCGLPVSCCLATSVVWSYRIKIVTTCPVLYMPVSDPPVRTLICREFSLTGNYNFQFQSH